MKDQFVIACVDRPCDAPTAIEWATRIAHLLREKGVMLLHVSKADNPDWIQHQSIPFVGLKGEWHTAIEGLPTAFNGILAVTVVDPTAPRTSLAHPKTLLRQFRGCKIAYLCIPAGSHFNVDTACLTLTHRREGKEKLVWASYLSRFCNTQLTIATPTYRDAGLQRLLDNNLRFAAKFYEPLDVAYRTQPLDRTTREDEAAIRQCAPNLLLAMTSDVRERDVVDWFTVRPERRLLSHPTRTPLLLLNPRDDLYILCD